MQKKMRLKGHIIDSLILSKLLDEVSDAGTVCYSSEVFVGRKREDISEATFIIEEPDHEKMSRAVEIAKRHGAIEF